MNPSTERGLPSRSNRNQTPEQEAACIAAWQTSQDREAARLVVEANQRHVTHLARKFARYGMPVDDMVSEGYVGLMKALDRFDASKGVRFSTYANYWIRAQIVSFVLDSWTILSGPRQALNSRVFFRLRREREQLRLQGHTADVHDVLAPRFSVTPDKMQQMLAQIDRRDVSLDATAQNTEGSRLGDHLSWGGDAEWLLESKRARHQLRLALREGLGALNDREAVIARERLLADSKQSLSLAQLGAQFGVSRERIRQLECRVKSKLQHCILEAFGSDIPRHALTLNDAPWAA